MSAMKCRPNTAWTLLVVTLLCACTGAKVTTKANDASWPGPSISANDPDSILKQINECNDEKQKLVLLNKLASFRVKRSSESEEKIIDQIMQLSKKLYGSNSTEYASALNLQGQFLFSKKDYKQSADSYRQAAAIFEAAGDKYSSQLISSVSGEIAGSCASGQCSNNAALYEKLLALKRKFLGNDNQQTMIAAMLLAEIYSKQKKYEQSLLLFKEIYDFNKTKGPDAETAAAINLARAYIYLKKYDEAKPLLNKSLDYAETHPYNDLINPSLISALKTELLLFDEQKQYDKSLPVAKRILDLNEKQMGAKHPQLPATLMLYADALEKVGKKKESASVRKRIRDIEMSPTENISSMQIEGKTK